MNEVINWKRFAQQIPWTAEVAAALAALGLELPPEVRPVAIRSGQYSAQVGPDLVVVASWPPLGEVEGAVAQQLGTMAPEGVQAAGDEILQRFAYHPIKTPHGDALRQWLRAWGWLPPREREQAPPPMVV